MDGEMQRLLAVTRARDRLRKAAFSRGQAMLPKLIAFSEDWLHEFQSLKDQELFSMVDDRASNHSFWGCPVAIEPLGAHAIITFADDSHVSVQLELQ